MTRCRLGLALLAWALFVALPVRAQDGAGNLSKLTIRSFTVVG